MPDNEVLSPAVLNRMRREMKGRNLAWIIDLFISELPNYIRELQQAITNGDGETLYLVAHKFKGACSNLGAKSMVELCKHLETLGRNGELQQANTVIEGELQKESERLRQALEHEKQQTPTS